MIEKRILNNMSSTDVSQFLEVVNEYVDLQENNPNPIYFYEDMYNYATWLKNEFKTRDVKDFPAPAAVPTVSAEPFGIAVATVVSVITSPAKLVPVVAK
jgi:hypothetical protein